MVRVCGEDAIAGGGVGGCGFGGGVGGGFLGGGGGRLGEARQGLRRSR
jgi:hypothetical protein